MKTVDVFEILDKGIDSIESLTDFELQFFCVAYLELLADMEGWDHFFTYSINLYSPLRESLKQVNDRYSLDVLDNYETHFNTYNVSFDQKSIGQFLLNVDDSYLLSCPDWREMFSELSPSRWDLFKQYYLKHGYDILYE